MDSNKKTARIAGFWYFLFILAFSYSLGYVPGRFYIEGDAVGTIKAIQEAESLFRLGIAVGMIACVIYLFLLAALYKLLSPASKYVAVMMVAFAVAHLPLFFMGHVSQLDLLALLNGKRYGAVFNTDQLHAQVLLLLDVYRNSVRINEIFMGLWLLPFGYLVFKSGILPRIIGIWLMLNGLPYLFDFFRQTLNPSFTLPTVANYLSQLFVSGEFVICLWLLIMGAKEANSKSSSASAVNNHMTI